MGDNYNGFAEPGVEDNIEKMMVFDVAKDAVAAGSEEAEEIKKNKPTIEIGNDVIQIVAGIAASKTQGVAAMTGGGTGLIEILGRKNLGKGVSVDVNDGNADIDVHIIASQSANLGLVFKELQRNVKDAVEAMTGLAITTVNVYTHGISEEANVPEEEDVEDDKE